jgi:putrescine transport system substrate-binding protein
MVSAVQEAKDLGKEVELGYVIPKEWPGVWIDIMAIPKSAPHPDNAHKFINFLMRPEIAAQLSKYLMQATPNKSAIALLPKEMQENPMLFPRGDILKNWDPPKTLPLHAERVRSRLWTRIKVNR